MRAYKLFCGLLVVAVVLICRGSGRKVDVPEAKWNLAARSAMLEGDGLARLRRVLPPWQIRQMVWPSREEMTGKRVDVDGELRRDCAGWVRKFVSEAYGPNDLGSHLVAMKNWGLIRKESEQKRLCDVFVARVQRGPYVVHIQEGECFVIITVADERRASEPRTDHKDFVSELATEVLNARVAPDPNGDRVHTAVIRRGGPTITRVSWGVRGITGTDEDGKRYLDIEKAAEIGTSSVEAETDGRLTWFRIWKERNAKSSCPDPYVERFKPAKSKSGAAKAKEEEQEDHESEKD